LPINLTVLAVVGCQPAQDHVLAESLCYNLRY